MISNSYGSHFVKQQAQTENLWTLRAQSCLKKSNFGTFLSVENPFTWPSAQVIIAAFWDKTSASFSPGHYRLGFNFVILGNVRHDQVLTSKQNINA